MCAAAVVVLLPMTLLAQGRSFDLLAASIGDIQDAVSSGALTYERLVQLYLRRIDAYDRRGPTLRAVIEVNPHALDLARALDAERRDRGPRGPLHGIPIAIKDNVDVKDVASAGGCEAFAGALPLRDATIVERLRQAGAIPFIKTNMDELALGAQGLSSLGGQIRNPYDLTRNPGGSSGGTGVAVNVGFAAVGVATETGMSIRSPASNNALVGIAPTRGLVSRAGVIPNSFTQDRVGVHAKSVTDAALLLTVLRGFDPDDLATADSLGQVEARAYTDFTARRLDGVRIGVLRDLFRQGPEFSEGNAIVDARLTTFRELGATVADRLSTGEDLVAAMPTLRVTSFELRPAFDAYVERRGPGSPVRSLAGLVASGRFLHDPAVSSTLTEAMAVAPLDGNVEYHARLERQRSIRRRLIDLMDAQHVDALVYPAKALGAPPIGVTDRGPRDNPISAVTGLPAFVVPAGMNREGLPIALEILGRPFAEPMLVRIASAYERASHARVAPTLAPPLPGDVFTY